MLTLSLVLQELKEVGKEQPKVEAELPANVSKNRYPHVLPCKCRLLPRHPGWEFTLHAQGRAHPASLRGSQRLAPLLGEGVLQGASVSLSLLETPGLRAEPGLSHHLPAGCRAGTG